MPRLRDWYASERRAAGDRRGTSGSIGRKTRVALALMAMLLAALGMTSVHAADKSSTETSNLERQLAALRGQIQFSVLSQSRVIDALARARTIRAAAIACDVPASTSSLAPAVADSHPKILGAQKPISPPPTVVSPDAVRHQTQGKTRCGLVVKSADQLIADLISTEKRNFVEKLFQRGASLAELIGRATPRTTLNGLWQGLRAGLRVDGGGVLTNLGIWTFTAALIVVILWNTPLVSTRRRSAEGSARTTRLLGIMLVIILSGAGATYLWPPSPASVWVELYLFLAGGLIVEVMVRTSPVYLWSRAGRGWALGFFRAGLLAWILEHVVVVLLDSSSPYPASSGLLVQAGLRSAGLLSLAAGFLTVASNLGAVGVGRQIAWTASFLCLFALLAQWTGYGNIASYINRAVLGAILSVLSANVATVLYRRARARQGNPFALWVLAIMALGASGVLLFWAAGGNMAASAFAYTYFVDGFSLGAATVVPEHILEGGIVFALILFLTGRLKRKVSRKLASSSNLHVGTHDAIARTIGYCGFTLAALVGLALSGVHLSNIALVAGALSVGIGFGLQNIVNNFVSGLILLIERPVRVGDWIVVSGYEGFVSKMRVRYTEIQTFDRAEVIVPNSELIGTAVTNWTLRNRLGRIILKVGVAYGTDTDLVRRVLVEVATDHRDVISDQADIPSPAALFLAFGSSSLDFELRCTIRDVVARLTVTSDLNFEIDQRFRAAGIVIPFPQRDVHLDSLRGGDSG